MKDRQERIAGRVRELAESVLDDSEIYIVDIEVLAHGGSSTVNVFIDTDDGINIDQCAEVSRRLSELLDAEDVIASRYKLNVSSPGADRPLSEARQYRKHTGRDMHVVLGGVAGDEHVIEGRLLEVRDDGITLEHESGDEQLAFRDIKEARVKLPW